ncbi:HAD hydrolase-like protein [Candidatus Woesearchaeota archaeon]|nr:HAD hydrolase-like protein [Candidatus Woesearchaeota archaeon]
MARYRLALFDEAGTLAPMDQYTDTSYATQPRIAKKVAERAGIADVVNTIEQGMARYLKTRDKSHPSFKAMLKATGAAREIGFESGDIVLHLFGDTEYTLRRMKGKGLKIRLYSSGSRATMVKGWKTTGGLENMIDEYHSSSETATRSKYDPESYTNICSAAGVNPADVVYVTDDAREAKAAVDAGIGKVYFIDHKHTSKPGEHEDGYEVIYDLSDATECLDDDSGSDSDGDSGDDGGDGEGDDGDSGDSDGDE